MEFLIVFFLILGIGIGVPIGGVLSWYDAKRAVEKGMVDWNRKNEGE